MTKAGAPCPTGARPSGLCHIHDPAVLCGAPTSKGRPCEIATGGGPCATHSDHVAVLSTALRVADRAVATAIAARVDRRELTRIVGAALLRMRAHQYFG